MAGCSTTKVVYIYPECEPALRPVLPDISGKELESVSDDTYIKLEELKLKLINWAKENEGIVKAFCKESTKRQ